MKTMRRCPTHPGAILLSEYLQSALVSQAAAARSMGWSCNRLNEFVKGKRDVTVEGALDLEKLTGTSAECWLTAQMNRNLWLSRQARKKRK